MGMVDIERRRGDSNADTAAYLDLLASYAEQDKPTPLKLAGNLAYAFRGAAKHMRSNNGRAAKRLFCDQLGFEDEEGRYAKQVQEHTLTAFRSMTMCYSTEYKLESRQDYSDADTANYLDLLADYTECGLPLPESVATTFRGTAKLLNKGAVSRAKSVTCEQLGIRERCKTRKGASKAERWSGIEIKRQDTHDTYAEQFNVSTKTIQRDKQEIKNLGDIHLPILRAYTKFLAAIPDDISCTPTEVSDAIEHEFPTLTFEEAASELRSKHPDRRTPTEQEISAEIVRRMPKPTPENIARVIARIKQGGHFSP